MGDHIESELEEIRIISMMERIERYILGKLTQDEIDELWIEFLKAPEWLGILEVEVQVRKLSERI